MQQLISGDKLRVFGMVDNRWSAQNFVTLLTLMVHGCVCDAVLLQFCVFFFLSSQVRFKCSTFSIYLYFNKCGAAACPCIQTSSLPPSPHWFCSHISSLQRRESPPASRQMFFSYSHQSSGPPSLSGQPEMERIDDSEQGQGKWL